MRSFLVCASLLLGGCATTHEYVRPWFRVSTTEKHVIAPHALAFGGARYSEILVNGDWRKLPHGRRTDFSATNLGEGVVLEEFGDTPANSGLFVYQEGDPRSVHLAKSECPTPELSTQPAEITCFGCGVPAPGRPMGTDECKTLQVATFSPRGKLVKRRAVSSSILLPEVEGRLPSGAWIVAETRPSPDFLFFYGPRFRHRLDERGLTALPYGSDPLARELDAERRAQEILALEPIRDRAMLELRALLDEEERAHPERVRVEEITNQMRKGLSIEPDVNTKPNTCYELVARTTPDLERIELEVSRDYRDLGRSISHWDAPPLARASGAGLARVSRCIGPKASEPEALRFRIEAMAGKGFIAARIYAFPLGSR
jgi:hypothetical protein